MSYAESSAVVLGGQGVALVIKIASFSILGHLLAPSDFGLMAMAATVLAVAELIRDAGLSMAAIQAAELSDDEQSSLVWANLALGAAAAVICAGGAPFVADFYDEPRLEALIQALAIIFVINGLLAQYAVRLIRVSSYGTVVRVAIVAQIVGLALALAAFGMGAGYWSLAVQALAVSTTTLLLYARATRWIPALRFRPALIKPFVGFGSRLLAVQGLTYVARTVDRAGLGYAYGARDLGLYTRSYQLAQMPQESAGSSISPLAVRYLVSGGLEPRRVRVMQTLSSWVLVVPVAIMAGTSVPLVELLLGAHWAPAAPILTVLCVGAGFQAVGLSYYWIFLALGRTDAFLRCSFISLPISTAIIFAALPLGAAWVPAAVATGIVVEWLVAAVWGMRRVGQPVLPLLAGCLRPLAAGVVIAVAGRLGVIAVEGEVAILQLLVGVTAGVAGGAVVVAAVPHLRSDVRLVFATIRTLRRDEPLEDSLP